MLEIICLFCRGTVGVVASENPLRILAMGVRVDVKAPRLTLGGVGEETESCFIDSADLLPFSVSSSTSLFLGRNVVVDIITSLLWTMGVAVVGISRLMGPVTVVPSISAALLTLGTIVEVEGTACLFGFCSAELEFGVVGLALRNLAGFIVVEEL